MLEPDKAIWVSAENTEDLAGAFNRAIESPESLAAAAEYNYNKVASTYTWDKVAEKYIAHLEKRSGKK